MENGICGQGAMGICSMAWLCMGTYIERCPGTSTWLGHRCVPTRTGTRDTALVSAGSSWCCITPQLSMYLSAYSTYMASRRMHAGMRNGCMTRCPGTALAHNTSTPQHNTSCCPPSYARPPTHAADPFVFLIWPSPPAASTITYVALATLGSIAVAHSCCT